MTNLLNGSPLFVSGREKVIGILNTAGIWENVDILFTENPDLSRLVKIQDNFPLKFKIMHVKIKPGIYL